MILLNWESYLFLCHTPCSLHTHVKNFLFLFFFVWLQLQLSKVNYPVVISIELQLALQKFVIPLVTHPTQQLPTLFQTWKRVNISYCLHGFPRAYYIWSQFFYTDGTEIWNFCFVRIAHLAEVFELQVNHKIVGNYLAFILAHVLRRELHLARMNVVSILNESCVEHDTEESFICDSDVLKHYFCVASHRKFVHFFIA